MEMVYDVGKGHGDAFKHIKYMAETGEPLFPSFGSHPWSSQKNYPDFNDLQIMPKLFGGYEKAQELGRDPVYSDVETKTIIGGFASYKPTVVNAMGSTPAAHKTAELVAVAAAKQGIPYVIGENVMVTHGQERIEELINLYHTHQMPGYGGVIVQGNANEIALDIFDKAVAYGADAIEIKLGQGAKPGLGGESFIDDPAEVERFRKLGYYVEEIEDGKWLRHSAAGTPTPESLIEQVQTLKEAYNLPVWAKLGGYNDIDEIIYTLAEAGVDNITIDGSEGGTGMAPIDIMEQVGLPTLALLTKASDALNHYKDINETLTEFPTLTVSGGIYKGSHGVKALALGADAVGMGSPWVNAARINGQEGVENFGKAFLTELQMGTISTKKYNTADLDKNDVRALTLEASKMTHLPLVGE